MEITYLGHSCFRMRTKTAVVVTDPFDPKMVGLKPCLSAGRYPQLQTDIVTISHPHQDHSFLEKITGEPFLVEGPGEYEIKQVSIFGIESYRDPASRDNKKGSLRGLNTIFLIETEGLRLCHLGDLGRKLTEKQLEEVNGVDILFVPVGGIYTLDPNQAVEVIGQVEPLIVVPMHYKIKGMSSSFKDLARVNDFTKELGVEVEPIKRYSITKDKLPEEREVVVMERKG